MRKDTRIPGGVRLEYLLWSTKGSSGGGSLPLQLPLPRPPSLVWGLTAEAVGGGGAVPLILEFGSGEKKRFFWRSRALWFWNQ